MPTLELIRGPALEAVAPDDAEALRDLVREQRARLETIREAEIWDWLGGELGGLKGLWSLYSKFVCMGLVIVTVLVAGFTVGPVLWVFAGLTALSILPYWFVFLPSRRRAIRLLRTAELRPAFLLAVAPELENPDQQDAFRAHVLVGPELGDPAALQAHSELAARITGALAEESEPDEKARPLLDELRRKIETDCHDGSRTPVPDSLARACDVAHLLLSPLATPSGSLSSRLLFVLAAPDQRGPDSARVVQSSVWGEGADELCAAFPREVTR